MATEEWKQKRENAETSLKRMQEFDVSQLPREDELGINFRFTDAVEPAQRLVDLFNRLSIAALDDFGDTQLDQIEKAAASCYNLFSQVLEFDETQGDALGARNRLIDQIEKAYQGAFSTLYPLIGYSLYKTADFNRLEADARAALQGIKDEAGSVTKELEKQKVDADSVLDEIRNVAAEQGVTQQAIYFKSEADSNSEDAEMWRSRTINVAWILGIFAILSLFLHKIPFLSPQNTYETVQLAVSKILIFAVLSYVLFLFAKNFLSHKHNAIVNRHRQNALMTYKSLVEAAGDNQQASDAVLIHAAACIYSPQATGYTNSGSGGQNARSIVELLSKPISMNSE
ncbi:MAG: hypothetical protein WEB57_14360 [Pseudohongiellaceae bacterium]